MKVHEKAVYLCQEFTDSVLQDKTRFSIIVSIDLQYFKTVKQELQKLGYNVIFTNSFKERGTITVGFILTK